jgi:hypothetical protein
MKSRAAAICLVAVTFAVGAVRAHAQGPGAGNSLAVRIAALEARVTALETIDESDIVGNWKWVSLGIEFNRGFAGTPGTPARVSTETVSNIVLTLNADHTVQFSGTPDLDCTLPILQFGIAGCETHEEEPPPPGTTLTWSFANGVVTILGSPDDGPLMFEVSANGTVVWGTSSEFLPGHTWAQIGLLVKMN